MLAAAKDSPRALALYLLAVRAGLGARECAGLDVEDVSADGAGARRGVLVRTVDRRRGRAHAVKEVAIDADTSCAIEAYLAWRKGRCSHFRLRLRTVLDRAGVERCHACRDVTNFLKSPLFLGRGGHRVVAHWIREEFRGVRRRLRLPAGVRFASLGQRRLPVVPVTEPATPTGVATQDVVASDAASAGTAIQGGPLPGRRALLKSGAPPRDRS